MQLPRGTFRSIQKGVNFKEILAGMASSRFTGFCTISSSTLNGTLVFRSGICVLAKIQDHYGDKGWAAVMAQPDLVTDLALSDFNTAQIQLALDFNKKARVSLPTPPPLQRPTAQPSREQGKQAVYSRREQKKRDSVKPPVTEGEVAPDTLPYEDRQITPGLSPEPVKTKESPKETAKEAAESTPESSEESDLDMFDSMDLDDVAHKIRKDCKIILKQLQLDHLTEK
ncbi:MAG: hypothetical protein PHN75_12115 [Syntrophales bacterium]|nr:hypothetical protein [Syntrophales bacterium]